MRILLYHPVSLPPKDYGGVERVVLWLAKGLVERGHEVYIAALEGSQLPHGCQLIEVQKKNYTVEEFKNLFPKNLDVLHFHAPLEEQLWEQLPFPSILTVHGNGKPGEKYPKNTVFLSQNHAQRHHAQVYVYNGIDPSEYLFTPERKENWYLFLSKTSWSVKNVKGAISYCKQAKASLRIAGGSRPWLQRLDCLIHPSLKWIGPVGGLSKADLLARARALIFPVLWPEPFGLVIAEALISGTPVLGSPKGSLIEMIPPDVGALLRSDQEWIEQLQNHSKKWDAERCRQWALEKFHFSQMAQNYENVYKQVINGKLLHEENPRAGDWRNE